jgi:hypothetical protein
MANDLIPPPSPAGRPEPDSSEKLRQRPEAEATENRQRPEGGLWAGGHEEGSRVRPAAALAADDPAAAAASARGEAEALAATPAVEAPYRSRFGFVLGTLIGVALAAVAVGLVLATGAGEQGVPTGWSTWKPTTPDDVGAAKQIAEHVSPKYRLGDGDQLVAVDAGNLEIADVPLSVAIRTASSGGDIKLLEGHGVMYTLTGLGAHGSIPGGKPSEERHLLLRREALELALYTFRYANDVDMVVALLPPPPPKAGEQSSAVPPPTQALFYRPGDLKGELGVPLTSTIPPATPRPETFSLDGREGKRIDALTRSNLFQASFTQGQNGHAFLVLDRAG